MNSNPMLKASLALLAGAAVLVAFAPTAAADPTVCVPIVNPNPNTNCVEVQPSPGFCLLSFFPNETGSTGTYVGCRYSGTGSTCAAAQYTPTTGYNTGYGCINVLDDCVVGFALTAHQNDFFCVA